LVCQRSPKQVWSWWPAGWRADGQAVAAGGLVGGRAYGWCAGGPVGSQGGGQAGQQPHGPLGGRQVAVVLGWWLACSHIVLWCGEAFHRIGVQAANFNSPSCFTSAKCVYSVSAISLIHGVHAACVCVSVAILDQFSYFDLFFKYGLMFLPQLVWTSFLLLCLLHSWDDRLAPLCTTFVDCDGVLTSSLDYMG
jgi:hypothetical protein